MVCNNEIQDYMEELGVIPVVVLENVRDAEPLANALVEGGLPCAEVTFRTDAAEESIRIMAKKYPELLVGAGTVLTTEQADRAVAAGAKFIVSPGFDAEVVDHCIEREIPVFPGATTPTEIMQIVKRGLKTVKFFPAEQSGGIGAIKAMASVFPMVRFMPTGGVNTENLRDYLSYDKIVCCGGSWMVKGNLIKAGEFGKITKMVREAIALTKEIRN